MKNGYYISAYLSINPLANLYDISIRHDQTVALWRVQDKKVELIRYWELERKTGIKKHSKSFFSLEQCLRMISILLEEVNLTLDDICDIWGTPGLERNGRVTHYKEENACPYHTLAHIYSGILISSRLYKEEKILAFGLDGGPDNLVDRHAREKNFYWGCYSDRGKMEFFPVCSPGAYWSFLRIRYKMEEGSLMALGSASEAYINDMEKYVMRAPNVIDAAGFNDAYDWVEQVSEYVEHITRSDILDYDERFSEAENRLSIIVKIIQRASKIKLRDIVEKTIEKYGINPEDTILTMTGGFALNCPTNSYLMHYFGFKEFSTCPCVSDSGIALGIGLYELQEELGDYEFDLKDAFHGSQDTFAPNVNDETWGRYIGDIKGFEKKLFAEDLLNGPIIWFDGQAEIGPRALGARSILGNPMSPKTKEELNVIKQRQWWRPVAPIIITGEEDNWFEKSFYSPYMLCTSSVRTEKREIVPAILHLDDSARIQSFSSHMNQELYNGLCAFYKMTQVPIICNTSLNDKGEPIIDSFDQCINFALRKKISILYFNQKRIHIQNHQLYTEEKAYARNLSLVNISYEESILAKKKLNPSNLSINELDLYLNIPELRELDISKEDDADKLKRIIMRWKRLNKSVWSAMLL